jgi:hypothetical protein
MADKNFLHCGNSFQEKYRFRLLGDNKLKTVDFVIPHLLLSNQSFLDLIFSGLATRIGTFQEYNQEEEVVLPLPL